MNISTNPFIVVFDYRKKGFLVAKPKTIDDPVRVSLVLSKKQLKQVEKMAILMCQSEGRLISVSEALRLAIQEAFPIPKNAQSELF